MLATRWLKPSEAKIFWHSATVSSYMWDGTIVLCQNNLVYFNPFKPPLSLATVPGFALSLLSLSRHPLSLSRHCQASLFLSDHQASLFSPNHQATVTKPLPNADSPSPISKSVLPIHSSYKPDTLDTHLPFHSITLSSNRDSQGFSRVCGFGLKFCLQNLKRSSVSLSNQIKININIKAIY